MRTRLTPHSPKIRRTRPGIATIAALLALVFLALPACSASRTPSSSSGPEAGKMAVADMPQDIGRGFPVASVPEESQRPITLKAGSSSPQFTLIFSDGRILDSSDLRGRPVMINFWATWCPPCRDEMPEIVRQAKADEDLIVLAVNVREGLEIVRTFAEEYDMVMPVVLDQRGDLQNLFSIRGMPTSIFIDSEGSIASYWEGVLSASQLDSMLTDIR